MHDDDNDEKLAVDTLIAAQYAWQQRGLGPMPEPDYDAPRKMIEYFHKRGQPDPAGPAPTSPRPAAAGEPVQPSLPGLPPAD